MRGRLEFIFFVVAVSIVCVSLLVGCKDDVASAGAGALTSDEEVRVCAKTLSGMRSRTDSLGDFVITQTPDSFLLGEVNTDVWATIKADFMTQFACPTGYQYPPQISDEMTTAIDSIALAMTCRSWFAEGNSPLRVSVYELDKATFDYNQVYTSSENINDYWSGDVSTHVVKEDQIVVAAQNKDSVYSSVDSRYYPFIRFMMNDRFVQKMNTLKQFPSQAQFNQFFKGLYITTTWGASTALYVDNVTMIIYYHYYYEKEEGSGQYEKLTDTKYLYANNEVRQVNRYSFPNKNLVVAEMEHQSDSINYVISPGYVYTILTLPMVAYADTVLGALSVSGGGTLQPYINKAMMRVDVLNAESHSKTSDKWANPASDMLLIRKDSLQAFFSRSHVPSSDYCVLGSLTQTVDSNNTNQYHYDFDVSSLLYNEVRERMKKGSLEDLEMVMVPVNVEYSTSSSTTTVSRVNVNQTITFTAIRSAQLLTDPLDIDVVFSGFTINSIH